MNDWSGPGTSGWTPLLEMLSGAASATWRLCYSQMVLSQTHTRAHTSLCVQVGVQTPRLAQELPRPRDGSDSEARLRTCGPGAPRGPSMTGEVLVGSCLAHTALGPHSAPCFPAFVNWPRRHPPSGLVCGPVPCGHPGPESPACSWWSLTLSFLPTSALLLPHLFSCHLLLPHLPLLSGLL